MTALHRVALIQENGRYYVTPFYRVNGRVMSVPDDRGFDKLLDALKEKARIEQDAETRKGSV